MVGQKLWKCLSVWTALMLVVGLAAGLVIPSSVQAATWYVDGALGTDDGTHGTGPGVDAFKTIQYAIDDSRVGNSDTINVAAGTYTGQILIQKSVNLIGAGKTTTIIKAPAARANSVVQDTTTWDYIVAAYPTSGTENVRIEGFTIDADSQNKTAGTTNFVGLFLRHVSGTGAGFYNCAIQGFPATPEYESFGIKVYGNSQLTIDNNAVSSYTRDGIGVNGGASGNPDVIISNNEVTGSAVPLNAIYLGGGATGSISGNTVKDHTRSSPWAAVGIYINASNSIPVTGNTVENCFYGVHLVGSNSSTVSGNVLLHNINRHITLDNSNNCIVPSNTITGTTGGTEDTAICLMNNATGNTIGGDTAGEGNNISLATSDSWATPPLLYVIYLPGTVGAGNNTIQYNTIAGGKRGIQIDGGNSGTTTIANNIISNTPTGPNYPIWGIGVNGGSVNVNFNSLTNTVRPIEFWGAVNVAVDGNTINGAVYDAINLGSASGTKTITNNEIYNITNAYGVKVRNGNANVNIEGNEIYSSYSGILTESNCTGTLITSNNIHDNTYGSIFINNAVGTIATIEGNTISNNPRGVEVNPSGGTIIGRYNSFAPNTYGGLFLYSSGTVTFENNWWGANDGPNIDNSGSPGHGVPIITNSQTGLDYDPWLVLGISANPTSIIVGGASTSTITADLTMNSASAAAGGGPTGTQIIFTTDKGSVGSTTITKETTNGIANATLTSSNTVETATVCAEAPHPAAAPEDQYKLCTNVNFAAGESQSVDAATGTGTCFFCCSCGTITDLTSVSETTLPTASKPYGVVFLYGLFSFNITDIAPGSCVTVTITLPRPMPVGTQYWKYQNGNWINCTSLLGDDDGDNVLTLELCDGGLGDADGVANGTIVDPGGPLIPMPPAPSKPGVSPTMPRSLNPPQMALQYLSVNPKQTSAGQPVTITTNVVNTGDESGNYNVTLKINGKVEQTRTVSVGPQSTQPVKFVITKNQPATYTIDIGGQRGNFVILGPGSSATGTAMSSGLIVIIILSLLVLATALVLMLIFRRATR